MFAGVIQCKRTRFSCPLYFCITVLVVVCCTNTPTLFVTTSREMDLDSSKIYSRYKHEVPPGGEW